MKDLIIKNIADIQSITHGNPGNSFNIKPVIIGKDVDTCAVSFVEVPPGKYAWTYHYHDQSEELFYIISGQGQLRSFYGEKMLKPEICFVFLPEKKADIRY